MSEIIAGQEWDAKEYAQTLANKRKRRRLRIKYAAIRAAEAMGNYYLGEENGNDTRCT